MHGLIQVNDASLGANCSLASAPESGVASPGMISSSTPRPPKARFQEGMVDEVSFLAPEMGPLAGVLVGVECGTWMMEGVTVSSSRTTHIDRCAWALLPLCVWGGRMISGVPRRATFVHHSQA